MTTGRWQLSASVLLWLATAISGVGPIAFAQENLPPDALAAETLSVEQVEAVNAYTRHWAQILKGGEEVTDEQVVEARRELVGRFSLGSEAFRETYNAAVVQNLGGALQSERLVVRLNAMIVASRLELSPQVAQIIQQAMQDPNPAVRYWAVKAIRKPTGMVNANPQVQRTLLEQLNRMLNQEQSLAVLEQVFQAMVDLELPGHAGLMNVINALNQRVAVHINQPRLPYRAEFAGMSAAYQKLLRLQAQQQPMDTALRLMGLTAARYMYLMAQQARANELPPDLEADYLRMADLNFTILSQVHQQFGSAAPVPVSLRGALFNKNWDEILLAAQQFRDMLTSPPFNFDPTDLSLTGEAEPAPAPEGAAPSEAPAASEAPAEAPAEGEAPAPAEAPATP